MSKNNDPNDIPMVMDDDFSPSPTSPTSLSRPIWLIPLLILLLLGGGATALMMMRKPEMQTATNQSTSSNSQTSNSTIPPRVSPSENSTNSSSVTNTNTNTQASSTNTNPLVEIDETILFEYNSSQILTEESQKLETFWEKLKGLEGKLTIEGFADAHGDEQYNLNLSQSRADSVTVNFQNFGLDTQKYLIQTKAWGEEKPVASNDSPEGRALNRRVVISFSNKNTN